MLSQAKWWICVRNRAQMAAGLNSDVKTFLNVYSLLHMWQWEVCLPVYLLFIYICLSSHYYHPGQMDDCEVKMNQSQSLKSSSESAVTCSGTLRAYKVFSLLFSSSTSCSFIFIRRLIGYLSMYLYQSEDMLSVHADVVVHFKPLFFSHFCIFSLCSEFI